MSQTRRLSGQPLMSRVHGSNRSAFYRAPSHVLPAPKRGWRALLGSRWATTAAASACVLGLLLFLSGSRHSADRGPAHQPDLQEQRRSERLQYGRVQRRYIKGAEPRIGCTLRPERRAWSRIALAPWSRSMSRQEVESIRL